MLLKILHTEALNKVGIYEIQYGFSVIFTKNGKTKYYPNSNLSEDSFILNVKNPCLDTD